MKNIHGANLTMKLTQTTAKLAVLAGMLCATQAAQATTLHIGPLSLNFNLASGSASGSSNSMGNSRSFTAGDVGVTSTAWSLATTGSDFVASQIGRASGYGLWACNPTEGLNCPSPDHQIDNSNGFEFVLFQFSQAVDPSAISIQTYNNADLDVSYFTGNTASNLSLTGVNLAELNGLGFGGQLNSDVTGSATSRTVSITNSGAVNSLLIGARIGGDRSADFFKINGLTAEQVGTSVSGVPEPGTFALAGVALVGLGLAGRFKKS
jgi:hypothetical protein